MADRKSASLRAHQPLRKRSSDRWKKRKMKGIHAGILFRSYWKGNVLPHQSQIDFLFKSGKACTGMNGFLSMALIIDHPLERFPLELSVLFLFHDCAPKRANARTIIMKEKNGGSNKRTSGDHIRAINSFTLSLSIIRWALKRRKDKKRNCAQRLKEKRKGIHPPLHFLF